MSIDPELLRPIPSFLHTLRLEQLDNFDALREDMEHVLRLGPNLTGGGYNKLRFYPYNISENTFRSSSSALCPRFLAAIADTVLPRLL